MRDSEGQAITAGRAKQRAATAVTAAPWEACGRRPGSMSSLKTEDITRRRRRAWLAAAQPPWGPPRGPRWAPASGLLRGVQGLPRPPPTLA